jgi:Transglycosylase SLT domain
MNGPSATPRGAGARRVAWRALLSALAGGGLTAVGLGGPFMGGALGAEAPADSTTTATGESPASTTTTSATSQGSTSTTTSTTPATTTAPTASAPSPGGAITTSEPTAQTGAEATAPPLVLAHHKQRTTVGVPAGRSTAQAGVQSTAGSSRSTAKGPSNVAAPPQLVAAQTGALEAMLAGSEASAQALDFYRIPLFLLPIYRAAAAQYDVPWPILAAINEIETNYGTDLAVSSAGAEGWMQFEPGTWLQYGVDALNAGYADPYNPVDAIFAAARYLNAAGAAHNLSGAIFAYNHSAEYVESVLLRAQLIAAYPDHVIATLTGLVDGRPPVTGKQIGWSAPISVSTGPSTPARSSATAGAQAVAPSAGAAADIATAATTTEAPAPAETPGPPGSTAAPTPASAAAGVSAQTARKTLQLVDISSEPHARAVAVQGGRIVKLGQSRKLGEYVVLRDVYGDTFTYAGLSSIAPGYAPAQSQNAVAATSGSARAARAGARSKTVPGTGAALSSGTAAAHTGAGKVRAFAHPGNPDARVAVRLHWSTGRLLGGKAPLRRGSVVTQGTVLGHVGQPPGAKDGHLRFAIQPAGDTGTIDPRAILTNWTQLDTALHPQGAKNNAGLLGATASDVFLLSKSQLEHAVLSDPGIGLSACSRHQVASGAIDKRALAAIAFLSRSGLKPTVGTLRCGRYDSTGYVLHGHSGDAIAIVAVNGVRISGHQGAGSITDTTIRTLLTIQGEDAPTWIVSLMKYPNAPSTLARPDHGDYIELVFPVASAHVATTVASGAPAATAGSTSSAPVAVVGDLSPAQWQQLATRIAALPAPKVSVKRSAAAIPDRQRSSGAG